MNEFRTPLLTALISKRCVAFVPKTQTFFPILSWNFLRNAAYQEMIVSSGYVRIPLAPSWWSLGERSRACTAVHTTSTEMYSELARLATVGAVSDGSRLRHVS